LKYLILLAHGSRDQTWSQAFELMTTTLRERHANTLLAFMELSEPSFDDVVATAVEKGASQIDVLPLFLAKGRHLNHDIPQMCKHNTELHAINVNLLPPIGEDPRLAQVVIDIAEQALDEAS
jgi:sirohydrochlorin cobaltochelatase